MCSNLVGYLREDVTFLDLDYKMGMYCWTGD